MNRGFGDEMLYKRGSRRLARKIGRKFGLSEGIAILNVPYWCKSEEMHDEKSCPVVVATAQKQTQMRKLHGFNDASKFGRRIVLGMITVGIQ